MGLLNTIADTATGGLASTLGSIPGAIMQNEFNKAAEKRNFNYTKQLNEQMFNYQQTLQKQQNDFNLDMWNKSNDYNTAAAQVQRLRDAGLNVGLSMGGQTSAVSPSISSANPSTPSSASGSFAQAPDTLGIMSSVVNRDLTLKQQDLQRLKIENEYDIQKRQLKINEDKAKSEIDLNDILGKKYAADADLTNEKINEVKQNIANMEKSVEVMDEQKNLYQAQADEMRALADKAKEERDWIKYNAITNRINAQANKLNATATAELYKHYGEKADSEVKVNKQQCENLVQQLSNLKKDGQLKDIDITYKGQQYRADIALVNGQVKSVEIQNWTADKAKYADVANAYIGVVDNTAKTVSHTMEAAVDVMTVGATTKLKGAGALNEQGARTGMFNRLPAQNPSEFGRPSRSSGSYNYIMD